MLDGMQEMAASNNPIEQILACQPVVILDGGLATALEAHGHDLNHKLWSAKVLAEDPAAIRRVHLDFLAAGADCITTGSYQASLQGFRRDGVSANKANKLLLRSVALAIEARDAFWIEESNRPGRVWPVVAAGVGPYGAFLADGSEYTGDYAVGDGALYDFHKDRWRILAGSDADLLACETIPSRQEADVLLELLRETPGCWAWMSVSCRDGRHVSDGTPIADIARACNDEAGVAAVGINCTSPEYVSSLVEEVRKATDKPIIVYPNSGERYNATRKKWCPGPGGELDWTLASREWARLGAVGVGGCCRVGAREIAAMRRGLVG